MQRYATIVFFIAFALGIGVCRVLPGTGWAAAAIVAAATGFFLTWRGRRGLAAGAPAVAAFVVAVFFAGAWRGQLYFEPLERAVDAQHWYRTIDYRATVARVPWHASGSVRYVQLTDLQSRQGEAFPCGGYDYTMAVPASDTLSAGQRITGRATLVPLRAPLWPDEPDYRPYHYRQGVIGQLYDQGYRVAGQGDASSRTLRYRILRYVRESLSRSGLSEQAADLTLAVVLGDKAALDSPTRQAYRLSGAMHLLVVSGLHVGIVAGIVFLLTGFLARRRKWRVGLVLAVLWSYGFLTGYPPPVLRALWMYSLSLLSGISGGRYFSFGALCLAGWADLAVRPQDMYSLGFQMSYAATAALVVSYGGIARLCAGIWIRALRLTARLVCTTLVAQAALLPWLLYHFDYVNLLSPLANLVLVPLVGYAVIPLGLLLTVLSSAGIAFAPLAGLYNRLTDFCTAVAAGIGQREEFAFSGMGMSFPLWIFAVFLCAGAFFLWRKEVKRALVVVLSGGITGCAAMLADASPYPYLGVRQGRYVLAVEAGCWREPAPGSLLTLGGRRLWFFPEEDPRAASFSREDVLLVRRYFRPKTPPGMLILAADTPWRQAERWRDYALGQGVEVHDLREKGYCVFAGE